jgi:Ca2+-binding EF-hand superfamily protein
MKTSTPVLLLVSGLLASSFAFANHHEGKMHGDAMPPMFEKFDENKDGRVSKEEMHKGTEQAFTEADTNKDGFVSKEEMQIHHKAMREKMHDKMKERWSAADKDGDGALTKAEVDAAKMTWMARDFDKLDKNKDGKLSKDETRMKHHSHDDQETPMKSAPMKDAPMK